MNDVQGLRLWFRVYGYGLNRDLHGSTELMNDVQGVADLVVEVM
jgi:hypothetical protein